MKEPEKTMEMAWDGSTRKAERCLKDKCVQYFSIEEVLDQVDYRKFSKESLDSARVLYSHECDRDWRKKSIKEKGKHYVDHMVCNLMSEHYLAHDTLDRKSFTDCYKAAITVVELHLPFI